MTQNKLQKQKTENAWCCNTYTPSRAANRRRSKEELLFYVWVKLWKCGQHPLCYCDKHAEELDDDTGFILIEKWWDFCPLSYNLWAKVDMATTGLAFRPWTLQRYQLWSSWMVMMSFVLFCSNSMNQKVFWDTGLLLHLGFFLQFKKTQASQWEVHKCWSICAASPSAWFESGLCEILSFKSPAPTSSFSKCTRKQHWAEQQNWKFKNGCRACTHMHSNL